MLSLLDKFAKPQFDEHSLDLSRARSLVGVSFFIASLMAIAIVFILATNSMAEISKPLIFGLLLPGFALYVLTPVLLRKTGWLAFCQHLTLTIAFVSIVSGIYISGGPVLASNNQLMIMQAALALFLLGVKGGLIWAALVVATQSLFYYLFINGFDFPNYQPPETATAGAIFNWALAFCAIIILILLIEFSRSQLEVQRNAERERLRYLATHDVLTELANRHLFEDALDQAIEHSSKAGTQVLLLYLDLDKFKPINDSYGHDMGDKVLKVVASRLLATTRDTDTVARLGGDEFAVLLPNISADSSSSTLADSIYSRISQPIHMHGEYFNVSCSIGICSYPGDADSAKQLWKKADAAMYVAKNSDQPWHQHQAATS